MASLDTGNSHDDLINVVVSMSAQPETPESFDTILFVDSKANSSLAGFSGEETIATASKFTWISSYAEAVAANTASAGSVGTALLADLADAFSGDRGVAAFGKKIGILAMGIASGEDTIATSVLAGLIAHPEPYWVVPVSHTLTTICDIRKAVTSETSKDRVVIAQTSNAASYGDSSAWAAAFVDTGSAAPSSGDKERMFMIYFAQDAQGAAANTAAWAASFNPDTISYPFEFNLPNISAMAWPSGVVPNTAKLAIRANYVNVPLRAGNAARAAVLDPGTMISGRPAYVTVSADWFEARLTEALADYKAVNQDSGNKLPMTRAGQDVILGLIEGVYQRGVQAGHFLSREAAAELGVSVVIRAETITSTDRTNRELRFTVNIPALSSGRLITISVTITQ